MKIAFVGGRDIHKLGGIENYMFNLATKLVELGHEPIVYCESDKDKIEWVNGFKVIHWKSPQNVYLCKVWLGLKSTLHAMFKEKNVKVIHYNGWAPSLFHFVALNKKTILMGHGLEWKRTKYSKKQQRIMKSMEHITAVLNKNLLMCSEEQTKYFAEHYRRKCITMPTAVNMPSETPNVSDILKKFCLTEGEYFLYLGRLVQDKNPDYLIKAFNEADIQNMKLVIAGANDAMPAYVNSLQELAKGNDRIVFTGAVYGNDKEALLHSCGVFCIPSTIEGLAITLLEAMSYGKPVIASDIEANKEGLGENGYWVKAEDVVTLKQQLTYCSDNLKEVAKSGIINKTRIEKEYTWDFVSQKYSRYINNLLNP